MEEHLSQESSDQDYDHGPPLHRRPKRNRREKLERRPTVIESQILPTINMNSMNQPLMAPNRSSAGTSRENEIPHMDTTYATSNLREDGTHEIKRTTVLHPICREANTPRMFHFMRSPTAKTKTQNSHHDIKPITTLRRISSKDIISAPCDSSTEGTSSPARYNYRYVFRDHSSNENQGQPE